MALQKFFSFGTSNVFSQEYFVLPIALFSEAASELGEGWRRWGEEGTSRGLPLVGLDILLLFRLQVGGHFRLDSSCGRT